MVKNHMHPPDSRISKKALIISCISTSLPIRPSLLKNQIRNNPLGEKEIKVEAELVSFRKRKMGQRKRVKK